MKKEIFEAQHLVEAKEEAFKKMNMKEEDLIIRICDKSEKENPDMCVIEVYQKDELTQKIKDFLMDIISDMGVNCNIETKTRNDLYYLNQKDINKTFDHIFYYDGKDLYFFVDNVTIEVGDKTINLSPMSYLNCSYQNLLEYYDKDSDTYEKISLENEKVLVKTDYMTIDVTLDKVIYKDSFTLLTSDFSTLSKISDIEE